MNESTEKYFVSGYVEFYVTECQTIMVSQTIEASSKDDARGKMLELVKSKTDIPYDDYEHCMDVKLIERTEEEKQADYEKACALAALNNMRGHNVPTLFGMSYEETFAEA